MIIGIVGYFTVPSVANYIVHAGGGGAFGHKVTSMFGSSSRSVVNTATTGAGMAVDAMGNAASRISQSMASNGSSNPYFNDSNSTTSGYMSEKLKGNS
jgi:isopentenyl phosphate kinase